MAQLVEIPFRHNDADYVATFDNHSDDLSIHHVTTRCGEPFTRRMYPSATPGKEVSTLIDKAVVSFVDAVLDGKVDA